MIKCECGKEITKEQDLENDKIARDSKTKKVDMCDDCWASYCDHAITGD